jgi:hypothetical protein
MNPQNTQKFTARRQREEDERQVDDEQLKEYLDLDMGRLDLLVHNLQNNGFAHTHSKLQDIIISGAQDAQYSRAAALSLCALRGFQAIEHLTVAQILRLRQLKGGGTDACVRAVTQLHGGVLN